MIQQKPPKSMKFTPSFDQLEKSKRLSAAQTVMNARQRSPHAETRQEQKQAASSLSPRSPWKVPNVKPKVQNYGTGHTGHKRNDEQPRFAVPDR